MGSNKKLLKAAFLDRDGVINEDLGYVHKKTKFIFKKGIFKLFNILSDNKFIIFVVTNQSGIARGLFTEEQYHKLTDYYLSILSSVGIKIKKVYYCPHHPDFSENPLDNCNCRKPKPGLFLQAQKEYNVDMQNSLAIGDSLRDLEAAYYSGIKKRILLSSRNIKSKYITNRFNSVYECSEFLLNI